MSGKMHEAAKKSWRTRHIENCTFHKIVVLRKDNKWDRHKAFFGNNPEGAMIFMWGRAGADYQLFVNGREYDWPIVMTGHSITEHVEYCVQFDESFYPEPNPDFPNYVLDPEV